MGQPVGGSVNASGGDDNDNDNDDVLLVLVVNFGNTKINTIGKTNVKMAKIVINETNC